MAVNTKYDLEKTQIQFANETKAFLQDGTKIVGQPIEFLRHIYTENIQTQDANARLLLETNSKQGFKCDIVFSGTNLSYRIEVTQSDNNLSSVASQIGTTNKRLYSIEATTNIYKDIFVPPSSKLWVVAYNQISQVLLTGKQYYTDGIERVG